ncbi:MAG: acyl carrier protein [Christensenellales bacterium]|jgi:acyl carrier protein|nr:acyl carrier protein [Clostridiales bacterium]
MLDKLKAILKDQLDIDTSNITAATRLVEDLKADSIDLMQMVMTVEIDFDVIFEDDDIKKLKTVGDVMKFLEKNKS